MDINTQESRSTELLIDEDLMLIMVRAVERVRERMHRAALALKGAGVPYAVIGGNAVAAHVGRVDESAVRNTPDVDILLRRVDLEAAKAALTNAGFVYRNLQGIDTFLDGPAAKARDAVHIIFAGEKVRSVDSVPAPEIGESEATPSYRVVALESLVRMKLTSFRLKDRVHMQDMIDVGLIDESWLPRLPVELSSRLKELLDKPEG
jgi:hypothetical protein